VFTNLVTHNEISIEAPAVRVWPHILDLNSWKRGPVLVRARGPISACGEVFAAADRNSNAVLYFAENVELVPLERRTLKLFREHEGNLLGFVSWELRESADTTTVAYDVYVQFTEPAESQGTEQVVADDAVTDRLQLDDRSRFQEELQELKQLVERGQDRRWPPR